MELKPAYRVRLQCQHQVLIVLYGIETGLRLRQDCGATVLIVLYGIETQSGHERV